MAMMPKRVKHRKVQRGVMRERMRYVEEIGYFKESVIEKKSTS